MTGYSQWIIAALVQQLVKQFKGMQVSAEHSLDMHWGHLLYILKPLHNGANLKSDVHHCCSITRGKWVSSEKILQWKESSTAVLSSDCRDSHGGMAWGWCKTWPTGRADYIVWTELWTRLVTTPNSSDLSWHHSHHRFECLVACTP